MPVYPVRTDLPNYEFDRSQQVLMFFFIECINSSVHLFFHLLSDDESLVLLITTACAFNDILDDFEQVKQESVL